MDCNKAFPINFSPNGMYFGFKSIGKVLLHSKFGLNKQDSEYISLCLFDYSVHAEFGKKLLDGRKKMPEYAVHTQAFFASVKKFAKNRAFYDTMHDARILMFNPDLFRIIFEYL